MDIRRSFAARRSSIATNVLQVTSSRWDRVCKSRMMDKSALIRRVYDEAMLNNLAPLGVSSLLGERSAFIRLSVESLKIPQLEAIANPNTVIMITPRPIAEIDLAEMRANLAHIEALGFKQGWSINQPRPEFAEFLHKADFIEIDPAVLDGIQLKDDDLPNFVPPIANRN